MTRKRKLTPTRAKPKQTKIIDTHHNDGAATRVVIRESNVEPGPGGGIQFGLDLGIAIVPPDDPRSQK